MFGFPLFLRSRSPRLLPPRAPSMWGLAALGGGLAALGGGLLALCTPAQAFDLDDHAFITVLAAEELKRCAGKEVLSPETVRILTEENLGEDLAFLKKFTLFSHYFNPEGTLKFTFRLDSSYRVAELQERIGRFGRMDFWDRSDLLHAAGVILHHVQDMAVPAHVLGVTHSFDDGFEDYETRDVLPPRAGGLTEREDCQRVAQSPEGEAFFTLHRRVATETLDDFRRGSLRVLRRGEKAELPLSAFWNEQPASGWGAYGFLGNRYGETWMIADHSDYEIPHSEYRRFKLERMRAAVDATRVALQRLIRVHGVR